MSTRKEIGRVAAEHLEAQLVHHLGYRQFPWTDVTINDGVAQTLQVNPELVQENSMISIEDTLDLLAALKLDNEPLSCCFVKLTQGEKTWNVYQMDYWQHLLQEPTLDLHKPLAVTAIQTLDQLVSWLLWLPEEEKSVAYGGELMFRLPDVQSIVQDVLQSSPCFRQTASEAQDGLSSAWIRGYPDPLCQELLFRGSAPAFYWTAGGAATAKFTCDFDTRLLAALVR